MKTTLLKLSALFMAIAMVACTKVSEEDINKISALENRVLAVEAKVNSIDMEAVEMMAATVTSNMDFMQKNYTDVSNRDFVINTLSDYRAIRKPMSKFAEKHEDYLKEIAYSKSQLANLKSDAKAGKLSSENMLEYIDSEAMAVQELENKANSGCDQVIALTSRFEELNPSIVAEMEKLK